MRVLRPRFTLRRIMIAVALLALYLGTEAASGRGELCRKFARQHENSARVYAGFAREIESGQVVAPPNVYDIYVRNVQAHLAKSRAYRRAEAWPWAALPREYGVCGDTYDGTTPTGGGIPAVVALSSFLLATFLAPDPGGPEVRS